MKKRPKKKLLKYRNRNRNYKFYVTLRHLIAKLIRFINIYFIGFWKLWSNFFKFVAVHGKF